MRPGEGDVVGTRGTVVSVCVSPERGQLKRPVEEAELVAGFGLAGDGHGGDWERQVSLLALESIERAARERGVQVGPGDFAENLTTRGIDIADLPVGTRLKVGEQAVLQVTQIGKEDHESVVTRTLGFSLIPREGAFARVLVGGPVRPGDTVEVLEDE
ncbi:MAG: MOSC domain-containing protein [Syntrophomonadaceae bacterium]|nr:MOSC domain-containing protein [Syntrophomonadaceae bacterium]